jgi:non-heme chloroperoxidase
MPRVPVTDDAALYCQDLGEGPAVVLLHGGCMSHRVWESQVCTLLEAGFRVVTPDLRGHGNSDKPVSPYTAEMYATDIAALVDALDIDEFTLVGWSLGATVVATFTETYSDRLNRLVLVSSNIFDSIAPTSSHEDTDDLPIEQMLMNQRRNRSRGMERFVSGMFGSDADEWTVQWLWSIGMQTPMRVAIKTLEIYVDPESDTLRRALADLDIPIAIFHGAHDRSAMLADAESIATEVLADGTFVPFEDSGHIPFIEEPTRFNDELVAFLEE